MFAARALLGEVTALPQATSRLGRGMRNPNPPPLFSPVLGTARRRWGYAESSVASASSYRRLTQSVLDSLKNSLGVERHRRSNQGTEEMRCRDGTRHFFFGGGGEKLPPSTVDRGVRDHASIRLWKEAVPPAKKIFFLDF